jgi:hypothetical protein
MSSALNNLQTSQQQQLLFEELCWDSWSLCQDTGDPTAAQRHGHGSKLRHPRSWEYFWWFYLAYFLRMHLVYLTTSYNVFNNL